MAAIEPTTEELQRAWAHCCRANRNWPATFEEAMADPVRSRLVRLTAKHPPRAIRTPAAAPPAAPLREQTAWRGHSHRIAPFDRKRAAAGDRDDD
jgi:hypothetical protein